MRVPWVRAKMLSGISAQADLNAAIQALVQSHLGLNWFKIRAYMALFSFELEPPHIDGCALGDPSEEITSKTCTRSEHGVI